MLLAFEITNFHGCKFDFVNCVSIDELNKSDAKVVTLHGSCFSGKSTICEALSYVKSIIVDSEPAIFESEINLTFHTENHICNYHLRTDSTHIAETLIINNVQQFNVKFQKASHITLESFPGVYNWFKNLIFIIPIYNESLLNEKMLNLHNNLFVFYQRYIYNSVNLSNVEFLYEEELKNSFLTIGRNGKMTKINTMELSFSLKTFLYYLPILYDFLENSQEKILFVDDIDIIANGLVKFLLREEYVHRINIKNFTHKQLIVFSNNQKSSVFTFGKTKSLESFI